jgi:hypothetical protein
MAVDRDFSQMAELASRFGVQAQAYRQQWANWLGLGSGGGILALLSFAANLPDPDYALHHLAPGIAAFTVGLISAAPNLLLAAAEATAAEEHFASAATRESMREAIDRMPQQFAAPASLADKLNAPRNKLITEHDSQHAKAERAWTVRQRWRLAVRVATAISAAAFILGVAFPLSAVLNGTKFAPEVQATAVKSTTAASIKASSAR